jgi:hypothetical protein
MATPHPPREAWMLWILTGLFFLRVLGQMLVEFAGADFLPPSPEWFSGLLPYPILLPVQVVMIAGMAWFNLRVTRSPGFFSGRPRLAQYLLVAAILYAGVMAVRYVISGQLHPERRFWPPGSIPIVFHFVLAGYVHTLSRLARRAG